MANSGDVRAVTSSLNDVNNEINKLLSLEESIDSLISSREVARDTGNHSVFVALDQELLAALAKIDDLERQIVAKLNKDIDFDKLDADKRMSFMLEENSDKALENEMLKVKLDHSFDEFISLQNQKQKDIDTLNNQKENLEKKLQELESQLMPDSLEIGRTKRELEEINKKIERLQKEVEKMRSIANIQDPQDISKYIEKNNRIINNNFRNMKLKGIDQNNYAIATDLLAHLNDSDKIKAQYDHSSLLERQYDPFDDIMTPQEFQYLAKEYEIRNGKPFAYNRNARTGLLYRFLHKRDMEEILKARYPHLAKPENKKELKEVLRRENDGLAVLLQSGITSDMMRNLYRDSELNIRNYQNNRGKREEWLNSIRLNSEPEQEQQQQPELQPKTPERNDDAHKVSPQPQNSDIQNDIYTYLQQCGLSEQQIKGLFDILNREQAPRDNDDLGFISRKPIWDNDALIREGIDAVMQEDDEIDNKPNTGIGSKGENDVQISKDIDEIIQEDDEADNKPNRKVKKNKAKSRDLTDEEVSDLFSIFRNVDKEKAKDLTDEEVNDLFGIFRNVDKEKAKDLTDEEVSDLFGIFRNVDKEKTNLTDEEINNLFGIFRNVDKEKTNLTDEEINNLFSIYRNIDKEKSRDLTDEEIRDLFSIYRNIDKEKARDLTDEEIKKLFKLLDKTAKQKAKRNVKKKDTNTVDKEQETEQKQEQEQRSEQGKEQEPEQSKLDDYGINDIEFDDENVIIRTTVEAGGRRRTIGKTKFNYTKETTNRVDGILGEPKEKQEEQSNDEEDLDR